MASHVLWPDKWRTSIYIVLHSHCHCHRRVCRFCVLLVDQHQQIQPTVARFCALARSPLFTYRSLGSPADLLHWKPDSVCVRCLPHCLSANWFGVGPSGTRAQHSIASCERHLCPVLSIARLCTVAKCIDPTAFDQHLVSTRFAPACIPIQVSHHHKCPS